MKKTILYNYHEKLNANIIDFAGYLMPVNYQDILVEHNIVRTTCGVFDISHMGVIHITGPSSLDFINYVVSNYISHDSYKLTYGLLLKEDGYPIDDLMVYYIDVDNIYLVVNASNKLIDLEWLKSFKSTYDIQIEDLFDSYSGLAIQGQDAVKILGNLIDLSELKYMHFKKIGTLIVSRSGYTGEDGFEVYDLNDNIYNLFDQLIKLGVTPIGLGARDTLRFEAGMPLYGHEISESINPLEAGLTYGVNFDNHTFIGKDALIKLNGNETRHLVGIELLDRGVPRASYKVYDENNNEIGYITTGYMLSNKKGVGFALLKKEFCKKGVKINIKIRDKMYNGIVRNKKFLESKKYIR